MARIQSGGGPSMGDSISDSPDDPFSGSLSLLLIAWSLSLDLLNCVELVDAFQSFLE
jgi:hypothetical protein